MQIVLSIGILVGILTGLVLVHYGTVTVLREISLYLLRAAKWCEVHRASSSASVQQRLDAHMGSLHAQDAAGDEQKKASAQDPVMALKVILRAVETVPLDVLEKALTSEKEVQAASAPTAVVPARNGARRKAFSLS
jgi:hypothetical protein